MSPASSAGSHWRSGNDRRDADHRLEGADQRRRRAGRGDRARRASLRRARSGRSSAWSGSCRPTLEEMLEVYGASSGSSASRARSSSPTGSSTPGRQDPDPRLRDRRRRGHGHRRAVLGRVRGADDRRPRGRSRRPARRCCAAAPSSRAPRPTSSAGSASAASRSSPQAREETGLGDDHRGDDAGRCRAGLRVHRRLPDRRAQFAELLPARGGRQGGQAGHAQARAVDADRGVAARRRVHPVAGQPERDPLRARDPHLREGDAQHARSGRGAGRPADVAPADLRRSEPRRRQAPVSSRRWRWRRSRPGRTG